jgi:uncharacterized protein (TIGR03435 family)
MKMRSGFGPAFVVSLLFAAGAAFAQTGPANLAFEVASVKPSPPVDMAKVNAEARAGRMPNWGPHIDAAQAVFNYMTLKSLIAFAYKVNVHQISGPAWLDAEHFDIVAKMPDGASKADAPRMLQALLEERFKLAAHRGMQEQPVLALVVDRDGPKLKESSAPPEPIDMNAPLKPGEMKGDSPNGPVRMTMGADGSTVTYNMGARGIIKENIDRQTQMATLECNGVTMRALAERLTNQLRSGGDNRPVVDMTGLKGNYQLTLEFSLADIIARAQAMNPQSPSASGGAAGASPVPEASDPGGGSSVFAAVKKLGLRLEPRKAPVEQLVIDHVEKTPTEN